VKKQRYIFNSKQYEYLRLILAINLKRAFCFDQSVPLHNQRGFIYLDGYNHRGDEYPLKSDTIGILVLIYLGEMGSLVETL